MFCEKHQHAFVRVCIDCVKDELKAQAFTGEYLYELEVVNGLGHHFTTEVVAPTRACAIEGVEEGSTYRVVSARVLRKSMGGNVD